MATIGVLTDLEEGHILPSFGLGHSLKQRGHRVIYIGAPDSEEFIRCQGFEFFEVFGSIYPKGFNEKRKQFHKAGQPNITRQRSHLEEIVSPSFGIFLNSLQVDILVVSVFLDIEALLLFYKFGIKPVFYTPLLREPGMTIISNCKDEIFKMPENKVTGLISIIDELGIKANSFDVMLQPLNEFCELILCPREMEIDERPEKRSAHYIGPSIAGRKGNGHIPQLPAAAKGKKLVYACLGSQTTAYGDICHHFFATILRVMSLPEMKDMHLVLAIGQANDENDFPPLSENVTITKWVSQIDVLQTASMAIVHGGLGTVKECIYYGVPMIIVPITRDQPSNAKRVEKLRLGLTLLPGQINVNELLVRIRQVLGDEHIQQGIRIMQTVFRQKDEAGEGADIIERLITEKASTGIEYSL